MDDRLLAEHLEALYGVQRGDFTAERGRRVKQLRAAGHRDEATALQQQRKPTVPAWAVDQLARHEPDRVAELIAAGEDLRAAQGRATGQGAAGGLREATRRVRGLVAELRGRAAELIVASGSPPEPHLDEVEQTLFVAAVDAAHHDTLRRGVFAAALQGGTGFDAVAGLVPAAAPAEQEADAGPARDEVVTEDGAAEDDRAAEQRRLAEERAARRRQLEEHKEELERARSRQEQRVDDADAEVENLRARIARASAEAEAARAELASITEELDDTLERLGELDA